MKTTKRPPETMDEYIAGFPPEVRTLLEAMRRAIRKAAPKAEEAIKYGIPTFVLHGNLVSFSGNKKHIGLYPVPAGAAEFRKDLAPFATGKATGNFPLDKPLPLTLIARIVKYRTQILGVKSSNPKQRSSGRVTAGKGK